MSADDVQAQGTGNDKGRKRDWLTGLAMLSAILAGIMLTVMTNFPSFFYTGIIMGIFAASLDFVMEYKGILRREWDYSSNRFTLLGVPLQLPILFFSTGVAVVFLLDIYIQPMYHFDFFTLAARPVGFIQAILFLVGSYFFLMYLAGKTRAILLGTLPISIAVYLWHPEPWFLALSLFPVYLDYYLERRMTRTGEIKYDGYSHEMAESIALCYFPTALIFFSGAMLVWEWVAGIV